MFAQLRTMFQYDWIDVRWYNVLWLIRRRAFWQRVCDAWTSRHL